jgi:hypothetical protein
LALAIGVLLALVSDRAAFWLLTLVDFRDMLAWMEAHELSPWETTSLVPLVLLGLVAGLLTLPLPLSRIRAILFVAGPFFITGILGLASVVVLIGWSSKPLGGSDLVMWLYPLTVPAGVLFSRAFTGRKPRAA